jgi:uncharacterized membrane protein
MSTAGRDRVREDGRVETLVASLLRGGVIAASAIVLAGGILYLAGYGAEPVGDHYHVFRGEPPALCSISGIVGDALQGKRRALIQFGLLVLIATPVMRVILAAAAFALRRDTTYVLVALTVLAGLLFSLFGGQL